MSASDSDRYDLLDRLAEEFAGCYRRGERPALQQYVDRHPELADDIRRLFPALVGGFPIRVRPRSPQSVLHDRVVTTAA